MRIGLSFLNQVRGLKPSGGLLAQTFQQIVSGVTAGYHIEHTVDDHHGTIHATGPMYERGRTAALGESQVPPFLATDFSAVAPLTWVVASAGLETYAYAWVGPRLLFDLSISGTTGGANGPYLTIRLPLNLTAKRTAYVPLFIYEAGVVINGGLLYSTVGSRVLTLIKPLAANWVAGSLTIVRAQIGVEMVLL
jgi:hypothetical protein